MLRLIGMVMLAGAAWLAWSKTAGAATTMGNLINSGSSTAGTGGASSPPTGPASYLAIVQAVLAETGAPFTAALIMGIMQTESSFNPRAVSSAGALGLMQVMPLVATDRGFNPDDMFNPDLNIRCGIAHLEWTRAYLAANQTHPPTQGELLSAYNGGVGRVLNGWSNLAYVQKVQRYTSSWSAYA